MKRQSIAILATAVLMAALVAALFAWTGPKPSALPAGNAPKRPAPFASAAPKPFAALAPSQLSGYMPPGAALYIETQDFSSLLGQWNASQEKQQWLRSDNSEVFSRSRLFLRLVEAQHQFAVAAGVPPDMNLLSQAAGKESALALYDIGNLEFLYIAHVPSATAMQSALWQARTKFESRSASGTPFFVHSDAESGRVVAFAVTNEYLLLATREDLLAASLDLLARGAGPKLATEDWFAKAISSAGIPGDLRMVLNMKKIAVEPHFRSYWIQPNAREMRRYSAAVSDLHLSDNVYEEDRVLLANSDESSHPTPAPASPEPAQPVASSAGAQAVADLLRLVPADAGVYRASADPGADASFALLQTKVLAPQTSSAPPSKIAPGVTLTDGEVGSSTDLEIRIDQLPVARANSADAWSTLHGLLQAANVQAMLSFDSTSANLDTAFVEIRSTVVLAANSDWDANSVYAALAHTIEQSVTTQDLGASWKQAGNSPDDYFEIDGLLPVRVAVRGKLLIVSNDADSIAGVLSRLKAPSAAAPATFVAGFRHAAEQSNFLHLVSVLDLTNSRESSDSGEPGGEPLFFSGNLASLSRVFSGLDSESVVVRDSSEKRLEIVTYRWK
jgi:hypothetical protein